MALTGLFGATAVVAGLLLLATAWLRRLQRGGAGRQPFPFEVLQRVATGPKQGMALVRCGERVLLMSCTADGMALVTELDGEDRERLLGPASRPVVQRGGISGLAGAAMLLLALVLPGRAVAQDSTATGGAPAGEPTPVAPTPVAPAPFVQSQAGANPAAGQAPAAAPTPAVQGPVRTARDRAAAQAALDSARAAGHKADALPGPSVNHTVTSQRPAPKLAAPALPTDIAAPSVAAPAPPRIEFTVGGEQDGLKLSGAVGIVVFMGAMTLLPAMVLLMTSFTRILIVLHFLRSALGTQSTPPGQLLVAIAVLLTGVVMTPVMDRANTQAIQPYLNGQLTQVQAYEQGIVPFREFMLANTRDRDLASMAEITRQADAATVEQLPTLTIVGAFIVGELRTAFQMGFVIFLPFVVIDLIVASVLMSMGMFMLPPIMIALPFKLLLFVLADGWTLVIRNLVASFRF